MLEWLTNISANQKCYEVAEKQEIEFEIEWYIDTTYCHMVFSIEKQYEKKKTRKDL